jgi:hypothetical protein
MIRIADYDVELNRKSLRVVDEQKRLPWTTRYLFLRVARDGVRKSRL